MSAGRVFSERDRRRLRWRARRGMLENDIVLGRFLDREGERLDSDELAALEALLELPDNELMDLLLGRKEPANSLENNPVIALLGRLRASRQ